MELKREEIKKLDRLKNYLIYHLLRSKQKDYLENNLWRNHGKLIVQSGKNKSRNQREYKC